MAKAARTALPEAAIQPIRLDKTKKKVTGNSGRQRKTLRTSVFTATRDVL
jgi:hypothetical protein